MMPPGRGKAVTDLFHACLELDDAGRNRLLESECGGDPELRGQIEELLDAHQREDSVLRSGGFGASIASLLEGLDEEPVLSRYVVERRLGAGGMGVVYLGVRADGQNTGPVAIKFIRRGMDSEFIQQRFRHERDVLASLKHHPNIVHLEDAGIAEDGRSFFVTEYIDGDPIDTYCEKKSLALEPMLRLFLQVCSAVQAAHQRTIIHRDLKPGNILVTADGNPKLLDFGIARMLGTESSAHSITVADLRIMTPEYASPEQIRGESLDVRTDVYSLGVILYKLLTGQHPQLTDNASPAEARNILLQQEARLPSSLSGHSGERAPSDRFVRMEPRLRGDLDTILLKALRRDRDRRYDSVEQFKEDIERYLTGLPVRARPDSVVYRASKFVRRHWMGVGAAVLFIVLLFGATILVSRQASIARAERSRAQRRFNDVRKLANSLVFNLHDAIDNLAGSTSARRLVLQRGIELLDSLAREAEGDLALQRELATSYVRIGDVQGYPYDASEGDVQSALISFRKAVAICESLRASGDTHPDSYRCLAVGLQRVGEALLAQGRTSENLANQKRSVELLEPVVKNATADRNVRRALLVGYVKVGEALEGFRKPQDALQQYRLAYEVLKALRAEAPNDKQGVRDGTVIETKFADVLRLTGGKAEALQHYRQVLDVREEALSGDTNNGELQRDVATTNDRLAIVLSDMGRHEEALAHAKRALKVNERLVLVDNRNAEAQRDVANDHASLARILGRMDRWAEARQHSDQALRRFVTLREAQTSDEELHAELGESYLQSGLILAHLGHIAAAIESCSRGTRIAEAVSQKDPENVGFAELSAMSYSVLGDIHSQAAIKARFSRRHWTDAVSAYEKSLERYSKLREQAKLSVDGESRSAEAEGAVSRCRRMLAGAAPKPGYQPL